WLNTSPLPRVWEQMNLAYEHGVKELWLVNVGDLKPMEYPISFWLDYAWNPERIKATDLDDYAELWAKEQFGAEKAEDIAHLMAMYTKYNGRRKPESIYPGMYSILNYNEAENFVENYNALFDKAVEVEGQLPDKMKDAYYQLVKHPIEACSNLNDLYVTVAKNHLYAKQNRSLTNKLAKKAGQLYQHDAAITEYYHNELSNGKWNNMMNQTHIGYTYWQQPEKNSMPEVKNVDVPDKALMGVAVCGSEEWWPETDKELELPQINPYSTIMPKIDVYARGSRSFHFEADAGTDWLKLSTKSGRISPQKSINVSANWKKVPEGNHRVPITITGPEGKFVVVYANVFKPTVDKNEVNGFVEADGCISIEAGNYSRKADSGSISWREIPGLGRTVSAMHPVPVNAKPVDPNIERSVLEYDVHFFSTGKFETKFHLSPTQNIYNDEGLEFAVSVDGGEPQIVNMHEGYSFRDWEQSVLDNTIYASAELDIIAPGNHIIKVWMVDPAIVLQKIVVYTDDPRYTYLEPPQSTIVK
ncbi:MAG TPA: glycosyl hydrolase 115 family protein, partial [Prolixibacteraceae bacterium]|nr:glycosyl hydrolase 115 family protein [Prolixibacteraceae bacterium]